MRHLIKDAGCKQGRTGAMTKQARAGVMAALLGVLLLSACEQASQDGSKETMEIAEGTKVMQESVYPDAAPPQTARKPHEITQLGRKRVDDYHWMRDANWQKVLQDPALLREDIKTHLESENAYYKAMTGDLESLRDKLYEEMRGRIQETEDSLPLPDGPYVYYRRYEEGKDYPIYVRRDSTTQQVTTLFDAQAASQGHDFFNVASVLHSPDHRYIAYAVDVVGSEYFTLKVRDTQTGEDLAENIENTGGFAVWGPDSKSFYYIERDANQRPARVWYHVLGEKEDKLVYDEKNPSNFVNVGKSQSGAFLFVSSGDHETSTTYYRPATTPDAALREVLARKEGVRYDVFHNGAFFYIRTNDGAVNYKIIRLPLEGLSTETGDQLKAEEWLAHREEVAIDDIVLYKDFMVRMEKENALPRLVVSKYDGLSYVIEMEEEAYELSLIDGYEHAPEKLLYVYESPTTPYRVIAHDFADKSQDIIKRQRIPSGHDPSLYKVRRLFIESNDGAKVPVTVLSLKSLEGPAPLLLYGYGSYGYSIPAGFSGNTLSIVDRGVVYAVAHVRGGSAMGESWYLDGKKDKKKNSFLDFNAVARGLVERGIADAESICIDGRSAGGLLVGASVNLDPELYRCVIAGVPFVDVLNTISDASLPLTPPEWNEWGNPIEDEAAYETILAYSPYDQIRDDATYPAIMATAGLADYRVTYWEPAKWIAKLREKAKGGPFMLKTNMEAGHAGSAARYERLRENAHLYAFALLNLGDARHAEPVSHAHVNALLGQGEKGETKQEP